MTLVASTIPNLVSGVSQQPAPSRLRTSGEKIVNAFPSVVAGLIKRPPTEFVAKMSPDMNVSDTAAVHMINRDANEKYVLVCSDGDLELYDDAGTRQTVTFPSGKGYLPQSDIWKKMRFVTVADTTFCLNTDVVTRANSIAEIPPDTVYYATFDVVVKDYDAWHRALVDGVVWGEYYYPLQSVSSDLAERRKIASKIAEDMRAKGHGDAVAQDTTVTVIIPEGSTPSTNRTDLINVGQYSGTAPIDDYRADPETTASVFIKNAVASVNYAVYLNDVLIGEFSTSDNTSASTALEGTAGIARGLASDMVAKGTGSARAIGTTVTFDVSPGDELVVLDEFGGKAMVAYTTTVQQFSDLPPNEREGRLVKIEGKLEENASSSYWVSFRKGIWVEDVGYNGKREMDRATMPHVLVKTSPGNFEFRPTEWKGRIAGDNDSNPDPSFVNQTINNMFLFKGRLGFLSGENVILSEVAILESFYRTTVLQLLSSDLIDVATTTGRVSTLYHATSFSDELILFSDKQQFRLSSNNVLSAETVGITNSTQYPCSTTVAPVAVGSSAYFVAPGATHSIAREIFIDSDRETVSGEDIAVQVPSYIPLGIRGLEASSSSDVFLVLSEDKPNELYVYKWYTTGREKIQSAWCKWEFDPSMNIVGMGFLDDYLYLVYKVDGQLYIDRVLVGPTIDKDLLLDHQVDKAAFDLLSYDGPNDETTIELPYGTPETVEFYRTDAYAFAPYEGTVKVDDSTYTISGDVTGHSITAGVNYEFLYEFSKQYMREEGSSGESAIQDGRLQLRYFSVIYSDTSYVEAHVKPKNGDEKVTVFNGRVLADPDNVTDLIPKDTGEFKFPVFAQNEDVTIQLKSNQPYHCSIGSVEWSAIYKQKAKRV